MNSEEILKFARSKYPNDENLRVAYMLGLDAGAKWQAEQDQETIELAEDHAYLAGAVNEREKMMKAAVEGRIYKDEYAEHAPFYYVSSELFNLPPNMMNGDKVRIIIVKEN